MEQILQHAADLIKNRKGKLIIGISGHGASGKTTFANNLIKLLSKEVNYLNTDPYIITGVRKHSSIEYEYNNQIYTYKMTACHPDAHYVSALERDIKMVRDGLDFYTIGIHYSKSTIISTSKDITIVEGMSAAFVNPKLFDLSIYLYTDGETEFIRRGVRDVSERGADRNHIERSHKQRRIQYDLFMHSYHNNYDLVIRNSNEEAILEKTIHS